MIPEFKFLLEDGLDDSFLPTKSNPTDTGWDVRTAADIVLNPYEKALVPLGFMAIIPQGWWAELRPRSSLFAKKAVHCLYGVIDEQFSLPWKLAVQYIPQQYEEWQLSIPKGERIGQIIPIRREEMIVSKTTKEEFDKIVAERGARAGFGSTGEK